MQMLVVRKYQIIKLACELPADVRTLKRSKAYKINFAQLWLGVAMNLLIYDIWEMHLHATV
jgi:hypothetical protein